MNIYSVPHSPFGQRVMMTAYLCKIDYKLILCPTLKMFINNSFVLPSLEINNGLFTDSYDIIKYINNDVLKYRENDIIHFKKLNKLFYSYIFTRRKLTNFKYFFSSFYEKIDFSKNYSYIDIIKLPIIPLYMFTILQLSRIMPLINENNVLKIFDFFDIILSKNKFIGGKSLSHSDIALFSHIQTITSGMSNEVVKLLLKYKNISVWIKNMNIIFKDYPYLISSDFPQQANKLCKINMSIIQSLLYKSSFLICILFYPLLFIIFMTSYAFRQKKKFFYKEIIYIDN